MKNNSRIIRTKLLILGCIVSVLSLAKNTDKNMKINVTRKFIASIIENDTTQIFKLLNNRLYKSEYKVSVIGDMKYANRYIKKYGLPNESSWYTEFDTLRSIGKIEYIVVPIYKGSDGKEKFKELSLKVGFDYTKIYMPDSVTSIYELFIGI